MAGIVAGEAIFSFAGAKQGTVIKLFCLTGAAADIYVGLPGSDYYDFAKSVYSLNWAGGSWTPRMTGIQNGADYPMFVAMAANDTATAYCAGSSSDGAPNVLKTINGGAAWTRVFLTDNNQNIATGWSGASGDRGWGYGECAFGIGVSPLNASRVLISDMGFVHKSTDGGATWQQAYVAAADQHPSGAPTPAKKSYHSNGLENTSCWQVAWADSNRLFACYTDIRGIRSVDAGQSWSFDFTGIAANTAYRIVKGAGAILYAATSNIHDLYQSTRLADAQLDANDPEGKILFSTNGGASWQTLHAFGHPVFWLALDPNDPNTLYASVIHSTQGGVFVSHDIQNSAASTWTKLPAPPRTEGHPASIVVLKDGGVVCTYSGRRAAAGFMASSGVFLYPAGAAAWTDLSDNGIG